MVIFPSIRGTINWRDTVANQIQILNKNTIQFYFSIVFIIIALLNYTFLKECCKRFSFFPLNVYIYKTTVSEEYRIK